MELHDHDRSEDEREADKHLGSHDLAEEQRPERGAEHALERAEQSRLRGHDVLLGNVLRDGSERGRPQDHIGDGSEEFRRCEHLDTRPGLRHHRDHEGEYSRDELLDHRHGEDVVVLHREPDHHDLAAIQKRRQNAHAIAETDGQALVERHEPDAHCTDERCADDAAIGALSRHDPPDERHGNAIARAQERVLGRRRPLEPDELRPEAEKRHKSHDAARLHELAVEMSPHMRPQYESEHDRRAEEAKRREPRRPDEGDGPLSNGEPETPDSGGEHEQRAVHPQRQCL